MTTETIGEQTTSRATPTSAESSVLPADLTVQLLCHKWTIPILLELGGGPKRPCDLERKLPGLSAKTLAERLHHLQQNRIITRKSFAQIPPRVEYTLTELGEQLKPVLNKLDEYGIFFLAEKNALVHAESRSQNN